MTGVAAVARVRAGLGRCYRIDYSARDLGWEVSEAGHKFTRADHDDRRAVTGLLLSSMGKQGP